MLQIIHRMSNINNFPVFDIRVFDKDFDKGVCYLWTKVGDGLDWVRVFGCGLQMCELGCAWVGEGIKM